MARSRRTSNSAPSSSSSEQKRQKRQIGHRGGEGRARSETVRAEQKARRDMASKQGRKPLRFFIPVGESKEIIIVDDAPDFFMYEHNLKLHGKWGNLVACINEWDVCPACEEVGPSYYGMFLTVIDLSEFDDKNGKHHTFSRKLMVVKPSQHKKFIRDYERRGTLRGALYEVSRDGPKDAAIGNDIQYIETVPDDELNEDYISEWTDKEGKDHVDNYGEATLNYEEIVGEPPTSDELRAMVGGAPPLGSRQQEKRDMGDDTDGWDDPDSKKDVPWDDGAGKSEGRSSRSRRGSNRSGEDESQNEDEQDAKDDSQPTRRRVRRGLR